MRFYLSSYKLGNAVEKLKTLLPAANKRVAFISNALDWSTDLARRERGERLDLAQLQALDPDLEIEKLDLREYFGERERLKQKVLEFGTIWVCGGNAFVLRQAMKLSGFDELLWNFSAANADMLYGGYSAGICILGPTLEGVDIVDPPSERPYGDLEPVWDGLGILKFVIVPHFESNHPESEGAGKVAAYLKEHEVPFMTLRDGEVIIIEDGTMIVGG
jgi:dipeptidase E